VEPQAQLQPGPTNVLSLPIIPAKGSVADPNFFWSKKNIREYPFNVANYKTNPDHTI
jgi:hypothetical protein